MMNKIFVSHRRICVLFLFAVTFLMTSIILFIINNEPGGRIEDSSKKTKLSARVDLEPNGLTVINSGLSATRINGKVQQQISEGRYILKVTNSDKNILVIGDYSNPKENSAISLAGETGLIHSSSIRVSGLEFLHLPYDNYDLKEFLYVTK